MSDLEETDLRSSWPGWNPDEPRPTRPISSIIIGPRFRKVYRNIDKLAGTIAELGLVHAIVVKPNDELVVGGRRIKACLQLGWLDIPVHIVDIEHIVRAEFAENAPGIREDFLPSELVAIGLEVEKLERELAAARRGTRTDLGQNLHDVGKTRDHIGEKLGTSGVTYEKMKFVVEAAEADPERFGKFVEQMDETGKVDKAYVQVKGQLDNDKKKKNPVIIPPGRFPTVVGDAPWPKEKWRMEVNQEEPDFDYPRWAEDEVEERLEELLWFIDQKAADTAILWLWATIERQRQVEDIVDRFGWTRLPSGIWHKTTGMQMLNGPKYNYEYVIIAKRGGAKFITSERGGVEDFPLCFYGKSREHSRRPVEFYDRGRRICPGPRLNMFSREEIEGFERHGNEVEKFDEANRLEREAGKSRKATPSRLRKLLQELDL